jgi:hypothetical protein
MGFFRQHMVDISVDVVDTGAVDSFDLLKGKAFISTNNTYPHNQSRFYCQDYFFTSGLQFQTNLSRIKNGILLTA